MQVRSTFKTYNVYFLDNIEDIFYNVGTDNSCYLIDRSVFEKFNLQLYFNDKNNLILIDANEGNKTAEYSLNLIENLIDKRINKNSKLIAIGGGIVQDIVSFTASILFRGLEWIFIPTTLLAQADSCIGGKSSINFKNIKNLLGTFNPPEKILLYYEFLNGLHIADIKSGIGEILHYYFYSDSKFISDIVSNYDKLILERNLLISHIKESLVIKKELVELDEFDKGKRRLFNYGHTFGHAIEALTSYKINHGQAVTIGMDLANYISLCLGFISTKEYKEMEQILKINFPEFIFPINEFEKYIDLLKKDKKNTNQSLTCILTNGIGNLFLHELPLENENREIIKRYFKKKFS